MKKVNQIKSKIDKVSESSYKNFALNIKPEMLKLKNGEKLSDEGKESIVQYYLEVGSTNPEMHNFFVNMKPTMMKLRNKKNLNSDEAKQVVEFYLESISTI